LIEEIHRRTSWKKFIEEIHGRNSLKKFIKESFRGRNIFHENIQGI
jgi:NADPH-dependent 7-cyano-7-deazaguanine reductase QueF